jgi:hypothetical protein
MVVMIYEKLNNPKSSCGEYTLPGAAHPASRAATANRQKTHCKAPRPAGAGAAA